MTLLLPPAGDDARAVATAVNQVIKGKLNSTGTVTLTPSAASTVVSNALVSPQSVILLMPQTAHAAAELATAFIAPGAIVDGAGFTITHASNAQTDRVFGYVILG